MFNRKHKKTIKYLLKDIERLEKVKESLENKLVESDDQYSELKSEFVKTVDENRELTSRLSELNNINKKYYGKWVSDRQLLAEVAGYLRNKSVGKEIILMSKLHKRGL